MTLNDYVPLIFRRLRPQSRPKEAASLITGLAQTYGLENIGEIDEQFLNGFTCASEIVIAQLEKEFDSDNKGEWIPVSKRLPDVEHVVYCQLTDGSHEILFLNDCEGRMTWVGRRTGTYNVTAWRELPESYKGE